MIEYQTGRLSKKNRAIIENLLNSLTDDYSDFYMTHQNLRLFLKENQELLFDSLEKGNKIIWDSTRGLAFITGYHDKISPRKYVKILAMSEEKAEQLLKVVYWHVEENLYAKVKKDSPIRRALQKCGFRFCGDRGKEILLCHRHVPRPTPKNYKEEDEE